MPDFTRETFAPGTSTAATTAPTAARSATSSGRPTDDPGDTTYEVDYAVVVREPGQPPRVVHDHHVEGLFPEHTWLYLLERAGFEPSVDRAATG